VVQEFPAQGCQCHQIRRMWTCVVVQQDGSHWQFQRPSVANCCVHIIEKQATVILSNNCSTRWQKVDTNRPFWIPKDTCFDHATWRLSWIFLGCWGSFLAPFSTGPHWLWSEVVYPFLVTSHYSLQKCVSLQLKPVQMFGRHRSALWLVIERQKLWETPRAHTKISTVNNNTQAPLCM
jgi:hypothetical protein